MEKVLSLLLVLVMAFTLAACSGKDASNSKNDDNATTSVTVNQVRSTNESNNNAAQPSASSNVDNHNSKDVRIKLTFNNEEVIVKMNDNPTSRDFMSLLPLTLTFKEFGGFEKLSVLDRELSTEDAPPGSDPEVGDFGYYAPWKDVNMYYKDWSYSSGLVILGEIESDPEEFAKKLQGMNDDFFVTIQKMN